MSKRVLLQLVLVAGLLLAGCAPYRSSRTCEQIRAANLRALVGEAMSVEQAVARVTETFHVAGEDVKVTRAYDDPDFADVRWRVDGVSYRITLRSSRILLASMEYESNAPSADQVIGCLGAPDRYWAVYYPPLPGGPLAVFRVAYLNFYFPALGITCRGEKRGLGDRPPRFDGGVPIDGFLFVPLGPPDEVMDQLMMGEGNEERIKREMKPWPGDWSQVEVHLFGH